MRINEIFEKLQEVAADPRGQMDRYLNEGKKVVICAPYYIPEEIVYSMDAIPFGVWGGDFEVTESKRYIPAFYCSIMHGVLDLGIRRVFNGASALIIPELCDTLKITGENWKCAVPDIPMIPMSYPENRKLPSGFRYLLRTYQRVADDLEKYLNASFNDEELKKAISIYNRHNRAMRKAESLISIHPEITARQRTSLYKSAFFMDKAEHLVIVEELIKLLEGKEAERSDKTPVFISGILADHPDLVNIFDELNFQIVGDDIAAQSRLYRTDAPELETGLESLCRKFCSMDDCSLLYDPTKHHAVRVRDDALRRGAKAVLVLMTKFCDPEEFDFPHIRQACEDAGLVVIEAEVDRQMNQFGQIRTLLETMKEML